MIDSKGKIANGFRKAEKVVNAFVSVIHDIASFMEILLILLVAFQVVMRYVFTNPIYGIDEFIVVLLVWSSSLGFIVVSWNNQHAKIETFIGKMPKWVRSVTLILGYLVAFGFGIVLIIGGRTLFGLQLKSMAVGGLPFSRAFYYALPMVVLGAILCFVLVFRLVEYAFVKDLMLLTGPVERDEIGEEVKELE